MSLMKTLAKVAIGVAVGKGIQHMTRQGARGAGQGAGHGQRAGGGGGFLGGTGGGGSLLGGLASRLGGGSGSGMGAGGAAGLGGLAGMLGGALSGRSGSGSGGIGGFLEQLSGGPAQAGHGTPIPQTSGFGRKLNDALAAGGAEPADAPTREEEETAGAMIACMVQAAKADGHIDDKEREALLGQFGDASEEERAFVEAEMAKPVDVKALAARIPRGAEKEAYAMSFMAIDLDTPAEARHLADLAAALRLTPDEVAEIHASAGAPPPGALA